MKVAFVTNFCPHYRVRTFELLAERLGAEFLFFSRGGEDYWPSRFGVRVGGFPHRYLKGIRIAGTRITPGLPARLLFGRHDAVIKCINGRFALPAAYLSARLRRVPFILWTGIWHRLESPAHRLLHPLTRWIYRHSDAVVVYGSHVQRFLAAEGVDEARVFIAPHAVDNESYRQPVPPERTRALRQSLGIPAAAPLVLFVGRLIPEKGIGTLLEAFAALQDTEAHLLVVGSGSLRSEVQQAAARPQLSGRIHLADTVAPDEVVLHYAAADLLVLPSVTTATFREPWGLVVNEAFNQGLPVVASDAVGAAAGGLIRNGVTGQVVPERNSAALAAALERLLASPEERRRMGETARREVLRWSDEAMVEAFAKAVESTRVSRRPSAGKR